MKKIFLSIILMAACFSTAKAIVVQTVYLKNGSVLNGYIQQQDKNENIIFRSDNATICIDGHNASTTEHVYKLNELDDEWVKWATENDAFVGTGETRTLILNEIVFAQEIGEQAKKEKGTFETDFKIRHSNIAKVKVLERGIVIKYLELTPNVYSFNWSDIESIKAEPRPKTMLSGIDRVYQLKNGQEIRGQYAGESYSTLSLYTTNGMIETFNLDDVTKYFYKAYNPSQTIFEQSELVDVVRTKNNGTFRGIIVERNFTSGNNYLLIQQQSGTSQMLKFIDVAEYSKEENSAYTPKVDVLLKQGEVVINRIATDSVGVTKRGNVLTLDSINHQVAFSKDNSGTTKVIVEYYNPQHMTSDHLILVKLDRNIVKKKPVYSFSSDIYVMKKYPIFGTETSVNNTTKIEYRIPGQGVFALYDSSTRQAMPFIIK